MNLLSNSLWLACHAGLGIWDLAGSAHCLFKFGGAAWLDGNPFFGCRIVIARKALDKVNVEFFAFGEGHVALAAA